MNLQSLDWTSCGLMVCAFGAVVCLTWSFLADRIGALAMVTALVVVVALCVLVSALVSITSWRLTRGDRKRDRVVDPRSVQLLRRGAKLERQFEAIRRERGIRKDGRLLPERRGPRDTSEIVDLRRYQIPRQAG